MVNDQYALLNGQGPIYLAQWSMTNIHCSMVKDQCCLCMSSHGNHGVSGTIGTCQGSRVGHLQDIRLHRTRNSLRDCQAIWLRCHLPTPTDTNASVHQERGSEIGTEKGPTTASRCHDHGSCGSWEDDLVGCKKMSCVSNVMCIQCHVYPISSVSMPIHVNYIPIIVTCVPFDGQSIHVNCQVYPCRCIM